MVRKSMLSKRGQVTIFVIVGILIVSAILVFFLVIKPNYIDSPDYELDFERCVADSFEVSLEELGKTAGFANPEFYYEYQSEKIGYLCYTNLYHQPCVVQKPFLVNHLSSELKKKTASDVVSCYENSLDELKAQGYEISSGTPDFEILFNPDQVVYAIKAPTSVIGSDSRNFEEFNVKINSPTYDILMIATSILQYEIAFGDSDVSSLMLYYPDFIIDKIKRSDGTTVYVIEDKQTQTKFQFASRSYAWPPGYGLSEGLVQ